MRESAFSPDVLQVAIEDHEIISQFIAIVSKLFGGGPTRDTRDAVEAMILLLNKKIRDHFAYEEQYVFTPLLAGHPGRKTSRLTAELVKEHETLLKKCRRLTQMLSREGRLQNGGALWRALMAFLSTLEDHASREDELFHALLEPPA